MAEVLGCLMGLSTHVTALIFVALGTGLPDVLASKGAWVMSFPFQGKSISFRKIKIALEHDFRKIYDNSNYFGTGVGMGHLSLKGAAVSDETADACLTNITGSNAVNVFVGLGLPWSIGSIYWAIWNVYRSPGEAAQSLSLAGSASNLGFCVLLFFVFALMAVALIAHRRAKYGAELHGSDEPFHFKSNRNSSWGNLRHGAGVENQNNSAIIFVSSLCLFKLTFRKKKLRFGG